MTRPGLEPQAGQANAAYVTAAASTQGQDQTPSPASSSPVHAGREPQAGEGKTRMRPVSAPETGPSLPALPFEPEQLVVVEIIDGLADTTLVHLPATHNATNGGCTFTSLDWPPATWPSKCQQVKSGAVYVHAGMLEDAVVCADCETAA